MGKGQRPHHSEIWEGGSPPPRVGPRAERSLEPGAAFPKAASLESPGEAASSPPPRADHERRGAEKFLPAAPGPRRLSKVLKGLRGRAGSSAPSASGPPALPFQPLARSSSGRTEAPSLHRSCPARPALGNIAWTGRGAPRPPVSPGSAAPLPPAATSGRLRLQARRPPPLTFFFRSRERFLRFLLDSSFSFCSWRACASMSLIFFSCLAA